MNHARHRAKPAKLGRRSAEPISWTLVAYLVIAVLAKHYFNIDVTPW